ncbi:glycosyltransferase involved in cell wall biosynthesis [Hypnocyclicus thermotrophus]|uniref:Glycosyltransferase involved in cell wall biosynthesis n=1 Tax=Hypnocyclicus thermotrophus TaxID=1627895 RepID=A0AA46DYT9_9FUSO|nr:glycosyltransferase [Hypnocyclicus thermotrophus]TDT70616.1 glycosyltransferase involved in cell wall biosynthesis [Hypnocyclicus thermotrophus]
MSKNICFVNSNKIWGGGEKWHFETSSYLSQNEKYNIFFICNPKGILKKKLLNFNINLFEINIKNLSFLNIFKVLLIYYFLKKNNIEIVIINQSNDLKLVATAARLANVNKIIYRRGSAIPLKNSFLNRYIFKNLVDIVIANSIETKKTLNKNQNIVSENKIKVIYNGIKIDNILKLDSKLDLRKEYNIDKNKIVIANIGRLTKQKGHKYLFESIKKLKNKNLDFIVLIIGDGELKEELELLTKKLNIENYIKFVGFKEDIYEILKQVDFLVHTALWEGFGYVLVESFACGKPVVATNISNIPEIVITEKYGYLAESENINDITNKIIKMIETYKKFDKELLIEKAREFDFYKQIKELERILDLS